MTSYFIWKGSSELFSAGPFTLRWKVILLILAFLTGRQVLLHIYKKEGKPLKDISAFSIYLVIVALLGARLGHVIFYEAAQIGSKGLSIFLPFAFKPEFHLLGSEAFSIHGGTLGILLLLWFYHHKNKLQQNYFQIADRLAIVTAVSSIFILLGSFLSSELQGKATDSEPAAIFISPVLKGLMKVPCCIMRSPDGKNPLEKVAVKKDPANLKKETSHKSIILYLFFKPGASEQLVNEFLIGDVKAFLYDMAKFVFEPGTQPLHYRIFLEKNGTYVARIKTKGISRYPVQLFEAIGCMVLFVFLFSYWSRHKMNTPSGRLFACFMILFWSLHFAFGFLKEKQLPVEFGFNILFVLVGITALVFSRKSSVIKY